MLISVSGTGGNRTEDEFAPLDGYDQIGSTKT